MVPNSIRSWVGIAVLLLSPWVILAAPAADSPSATGLWKVEGDVMGRPVTMMCQLTEGSRKLSGTCSGAADGFAVHTVVGTVKAQKVQFYFQTSIGGGSITLIVSGTLNEDRSKFNGDLDVEPMAVGGVFEAVREPAAGALPDAEAAPAAAADATAPAESPLTGNLPAAAGTWKIDGDVQGTPVKLTCVLTQENSKLSGTCSGDQTGTRSLTGAVTEKGFGWRFDSEYQGQPITVIMRATLSPDGSRMSGTMTVAPLAADGTFSGMRQ